MRGNVEFVGPICESTDTFLKYKTFSKLNEGDYVAITNVGAYGSTLSSNYNTRPLALEILSRKGKLKSWPRPGWIIAITSNPDKSTPSVLKAAKTASFNNCVILYSCSFFLPNSL